MTLSIVLILSGGYYAYFSTTVKAQLKESLLKKGRTIVQTTAVNLGASLYLTDSGLIQNLMLNLENDQDISFIYVANPAGEMAYGYNYNRNLKLINSALNSNQIQNYTKDYLVLKQSIFFHDEYYGDVIVGFSLRWVNAQIASQTRNLIIVSVVLALILIFLGVFLGNRISNPLKEATETIQNYSQNESALSLRLPVKGDDEIAQLARSLNSLADNLDNNIHELNKSKKYLETLFQLSPIPIIIADTLGQIEGVNESASSFFGVEPSVLIKINLDRFFQPDDLNAIFNRIIQDMQDIRGFVTTLRMTDGTKKVVELNVSSHQDELNYVKNIIIAIIDITEKIQIQREILHNQTKLQRINNELTVKTEELEQLSTWNKKNAHNLGQLINISQQMMRSTAANEILQKIIEDGRRLLEATDCAIFLWDNKSDKLIPSVVSSDDLRNRLQPVTQEHKNLIWRTYRENEPFVFDSAELSEKEVEMLGIRAASRFSVVSVPISEKDYRFGVILLVKYNHQNYRLEDVHLLSTLANQAAILLDNMHLVHALKEKAVSLEKAYGEVQRSQQQVIQLQKMESLGTLVGGIAHDFNNILGIIIPNTELLRVDANGNNSINRRANIITEAAQRAADLTRQLLMFSRNQDIQVKVFSPNQLITRLSTMFKRTLGKEYEILLDLDPDVDDVEADENRLTQVLINLAVNARDAMPDGGEIVIRTFMAKYKPRADKFAREKEYACISITDTGCGIRNEDLDKIFDPFFTTKSVGKGTGLGLSVVYGIMQSHKGYVDVESTVNKGTTFYLYLPPTPRKFVEVEAPPKPRGHAIPKGSENILVVDDENMIRDSVKEILESLGYSVTEAASGIDAIRIVQQKKRRYQLAIVDMSMPKMNGVETIRKIRELDKSVKVILSSGHIDRDKLVPADLKVEGTLPKPYRIRELAMKVRQVLSQKAAVVS